jgi:hypothetical protein
MTTKPMPNSQTQIVDQSGRVQEPWHSYLAQIFGLTKRVAAPVTALPVSPTNAQIQVAFNDLLDKLQNANLMEKP